MSLLGLLKEVCNAREVQSPLGTSLQKAVDCDHLVCVITDSVTRDKNGTVQPGENSYTTHFFALLLSGSNEMMYSRQYKQS